MPRPTWTGVEWDLVGVTDGESLLGTLVWSKTPEGERRDNVTGKVRNSLHFESTSQSSTWGLTLTVRRDTWAGVVQTV